MRPGTIGSPSFGCIAGTGPALVSTLGSTLFTPGARCQTTKSAAGRSAGRPAASFSSACMPPAEAPITTMSFFAIPGALQASGRPVFPLGVGLFHQEDHALALLAGREERRAGHAALDL